MKKNLWYIVTKASDDGSFEVGDHILMEKNGDISCKEAGGWVSSIDVPEAIVGMEIEIDRERILEKIEKLQKEISILQSQLV